MPIIYKNITLTSSRHLASVLGPKSERIDLRKIPRESAIPTDDKPKITRGHFSAMVTTYLKSYELKHQAENGAICLGQKMAAFSDSLPMNTPNLQSCIFLVIADPMSSFSMGVHVDRKVSKDGIRTLIDDFLLRLEIEQSHRGDYELDCYMVGGSGGTTCELDEIFGALNEYKVDVKAAHLSLDDGVRPVDISWCPRSRRFYPAVMPYSDEATQTAYIYSSTGDKTILVTCVKGNEHKNYPVVIPEPEKEMLMEFNEDTWRKLFSEDSLDMLFKSLRSPYLDHPNGIFSIYIKLHYLVKEGYLKPQNQDVYHQLDIREVDAVNDPDAASEEGPRPGM